MTYPVALLALGVVALFWNACTAIRFVRQRRWGSAAISVACVALSFFCLVAVWPFAWPRPAVCGPRDLCPGESMHCECPLDGGPCDCRKIEEGERT